jgi:hypothetical protein
MGFGWDYGLLCSVDGAADADRKGRFRTKGILFIRGKNRKSCLDVSTANGIPPTGRGDCQ